MPFWTVLFARLILHEEIRARQWIAIAARCARARDCHCWALITRFRGRRRLCHSRRICWALGTVIWKRTLQDYTVDPS